SVENQYRESDEALASFGEHDEVVLWFEHDLYDQLVLIRHLDFFSKQELNRTRLSLICIGEFPGRDSFHGLGELTPEQLYSLFPSRHPITSGQLELGRRAWAAFTATDPGDLDNLASEDTRPLPFLASALRRFLEEYPSSFNGLGRTEQQILSLLYEGGKSPAELFVSTYKLEEAIFMGDSTFWGRVKALGTGAWPLVTLDVVETPDRYPQGQVKITDLGLEVLEGRNDWVELNGIDRWFGGVHLQGSSAAWRWDKKTSRLRAYGG
ncbi:MAG TPA: RNA polymerase subunit sigma-24, partial [Blastocatellia bacterium]|nr:RNA polymerase subunit sigma-24 [Blastocatellia bacterium]